MQMLVEYERSCSERVGTKEARLSQVWPQGIRRTNIKRIRDEIIRSLYVSSD